MGDYATTWFGGEGAPSLSGEERARPSRRGVTLVELLITMTIMAIIAAAVLGTAAAAIESGREKKTRSLIAKIHTLLMEHYASYETRRIPLHATYTDSIAASFTGAEYGRAKADCRLLALRELQKYEMPDRWNDILSDPLMFTIQDVPLANKYRDAYYGDGTNLASTNWQGAECLYLVVMKATGEGEAASLFSKQDIGDVDGDGRNEFIDGWGRPISWLRWPSGFSRTSLMTGDATADHDPFDFYVRDKIPVIASDSQPTYDRYKQPASGGAFNVQNRLQLLLPQLRDDNPAFRLVPLVFSIGADEEQMVTSKPNDFIAGLDPYTIVDVPGNPEDAGRLPGTVKPDGGTDDITNHLLEY